MGWTKEQRREYMRKYRLNPENKKKANDLSNKYYQDNKSKVLVNQRQRHKVLREDLIEKLGSECVKCGSKENLEFNHIDPLDKTTEVCYTHLMANTDEYKKCELLCKTCHKKHTSAENYLMRKYWLENVSLEVRRQLIDEHTKSDAI
jgi:5-methylcytosine-specific restriction endonuclease McrA